MGGKEKSKGFCAQCRFTSWEVVVYLLMRVKLNHILFGGRGSWEATSCFLPLFCMVVDWMVLCLSLYFV